MIIVLLHVLYIHHIFATTWCYLDCVLHSSYFHYYLVPCYLCLTFVMLLLLPNIHCVLVVNQCSLCYCCCLVFIMLFCRLTFIVLLLLDVHSVIATKCSLFSYYYLVFIVQFSLMPNVHHVVISYSSCHS
jgi:hypothetical protein